ncbi:MAG: GAF domain-containing sensor histidine kinase [Deltaproteobacteria bacterium]|nr:GAF domain-containing sensor histidine kinase [Deltaproteobacteria bacterium]
MVIICSYLLLFSTEGWLDPVAAYALLFYMLSNTALYLVDEELFSSAYFYTPLVIFDTLFIAATMALSRQATTEFYLGYFLTIILCSLCRDFRGLIIIALLAPLVHGYLLFKSAEVYDPSTYLRLPLPFVMAIFYGYFAQLENFERSLKEKAEQEARNMAMVHSLSQALTRSLDTRQILQTLREKIHQVLPAAKLYVFVVDEGSRASHALLFDIGKEETSAPRAVSLQDFSIVAESLASGEPVFSRSAQLASVVSEGQGAAGGLSFAAAMAIPIAFRGESYGAILLGFDETQLSLSPRENEYGKIVAFATAIALNQSKREEQIQRHVRGITALHEINLATTSTLDLPAVLEILVQKIEPLLPRAAVTAVRMINRETGRLEAAAFRNMTRGEWTKGIPEGGRGLSRAVLERKAPVFVENVLKDPRTRYPEFFRKHGLVSYLGVPLVAKGEVLGDICIFTREERPFTNGEVKFFSTLAGQAAIAIHNAQLFEDIKQQAVELERANSVKSEFLSVMSHELRTPLNVVMGYTGLIQDKMLGEINERQEKALEKVIRHSGELLSMITSILDVTALEAQMIKFEREEVKLSEVLNELRLAYDVPLVKGLTLIWDYPSELPTLRTDRGKLRHILRNLINNAIKFTENGSVTVSAWYYPARRAVEVKVADTGIGVSPEALPVIFDRFRQMDSSETRVYGGVGLGLYIVKRFTELLGGRIVAESKLGEGSIFTLVLPY